MGRRKKVEVPNEKQSLPGEQLEPIEEVAVTETESSDVGEEVLCQESEVELPEQAMPAPEVPGKYRKFQQP